MVKNVKAVSKMPIRSFIWFKILNSGYKGFPKKEGRKYKQKITYSRVSHQFEVNLDAE